MKVARRISFISGVVIAAAFFLLTFIQSPTLNIGRLFGQLLGSLGIGAVAFLIFYGISALVVRIAKIMK